MNYMKLNYTGQSLTKKNNKMHRFIETCACVLKSGNSVPSLPIPYTKDT